MSSQRWSLAKTWTRWTKQAGLGVAGASGLVPSVFLTRKAILMDSGSMKDVPLVSGMRQTLEVVGEKELSEWGSTARHAAPSGCCSFCQARRPRPLRQRRPLPPPQPQLPLYGLCCATLHLLHALPRLIQEALHVTGPAYDLRRRLRLG